MNPLSVFFAALMLAAQTPQYPNYPSETPAKFEPVTSSFDYTRRDVMIPMRDGVVPPAVRSPKIASASLHRQQHRLAGYAPTLHHHRLIARREPAGNLHIDLVQTHEIRRQAAEAHRRI